MNIKKTRLVQGKHPMGMRKTKTIKKIETIVKSIDKWARIIPGRFTSCKFAGCLVEVINSPKSEFNLFLKIKNNKIFQKIKIECSNANRAVQIKNLINDI